MSAELTAKVWASQLAAGGKRSVVLGHQMLGVAHIIAENRPLLNSLTDPARSNADKQKLAREVFTGTADAAVVEQLCELVTGHWLDPIKLLTRMHDLGIESVIAGSVSASVPVEDELFAVINVLKHDRQLRQALDPSRLSTADQRAQLATRLFESQLSEAALTLLVWCARHEVRAGITYNLRRVCELAARRRGLVIADVTSAVELTQAQQQRLIKALAKRTGHDVELHLEVDPEVIGGLRILVDERLYDNTTRSALKALRTQIA